MPHRPREERQLERIRAAASTARALTGSALDAALAQIGAAFDDAAAVNAFKLRIERWVRLGPNDAAARAAMLSGRDLHAAIVLVERWWRDERKAFQIANALGYGNRLSLDVLGELRLILRFMRLTGLQTEFGALVAAVCDDEMALLAAE